MEGDILMLRSKMDRLNISTHALRMEGDSTTLFLPTRTAISTHALRMEGDDMPLAVLIRLANISTHALRMEGDLVDGALDDSNHNFYPRPPHGGRLDSSLNNVNHKIISTHALRMEGDNRHITH